MHEDNIKYQLEKLYPNGTVEGLAKVDNVVYSNVRKNALQMGVTIEEYLKSLGFVYNKNFHKREIDYQSARRLFDEYNVTLREMGEWLGVSRERVRQILNKHNKVSTITWEHELMDETEQEMIQFAIEHEICSVMQDEIRLDIKRRNDYSAICLVFTSNDGVKCIFNIPNTLLETMQTKHFDILEESDFKLKKSIRFVEQESRKLVVIDNANVRQRISNRAKKLGLDVREYVKLLEFDDIFDSRIITDEEYKQILSKYVETGNIVYIPVSSEDYHRLAHKASRTGKSLDEFIAQFGFVKAERKFELEELKKIEEYRIELEEIAVDNKVWIDTESKLYRKLNGFLWKRDISINEFLQQLGFERIYKTDGDETNTLDRYYFENIGDNDLQSLLSELDKIQSELDIEIRTEEKIKRNRTLVGKLKKLYRYQCQICTEENGFPIIEKMDGAFYVEVHHIEHLSKSKLFQDSEVEGNELDNYKNLIVICPFHHKMLHHHHGGFEEIITDELGKFFRSKRGTILRISTNYHL